MVIINHKSQTNTYTCICSDIWSLLLIGTQFYNDLVHGRNEYSHSNHLHVNGQVLLSFIFSCYNAICYYRTKGNVGICWIYYLYFE